MFYSGDETDPAEDSAHEMMHEYPAFQYYFQEWMPGLTDVEFPKAQYDAEIAYVDAALAHVWARLSQMAADEQPAVIVTSDHGEELDEHRMWFDHHGLYETNLHVPLVLYHPERLAGGRRLGGLTRHQDLAPTVLDLLGLGDAAEEQRLEGQSLLPLIEAGSDQGSCDGVYLTECAWMKKRGLRTRQYKYIESLHDELHKRPPFELYDLTEDPGEQRNLADDRPEVVARFRRELEEHRRRRMAETGLPDPQDHQEITLRQVGNVNLAVPENQKLEE